MKRLRFVQTENKTYDQNLQEIVSEKRRYLFSRCNITNFNIDIIICKYTMLIAV